MSYQAPTVPLSEIVSPPFQLLSGLLCQHRSSSDPPVGPLEGMSGSCNIWEPLEWPDWLHSSSRSVGRDLGADTE